MSSRISRRSSLFVISIMFLLTMVFVAKAEANAFQYPITLLLLESGLRYFIISLPFGAATRRVSGSNGNVSSFIVLPLAITGMLTTSVVYTVIRHEVILIATPSLFILPGALIGWDLANWYLHKTRPAQV